MTSASGNITRCLLCVAALFAGVPLAGAETKCETRTQVCIDVRGGARICQVTICKDEKGDIVSTDVIVLKTSDDGGTTAPSVPKVRIPKTQVEGLKQ